MLYSCRYEMSEHNQTVVRPKKNFRLKFRNPKSKKIVLIFKEYGKQISASPAQKSLIGKTPSRRDLYQPHYVNSMIKKSSEVSNDAYKIKPGDYPSTKLISNSRK